MIVQDLLNAKETQDVATSTADRSVAEAVRHLHQRRIGALVIVDVTGRIDGILSERDIVRGLAQKGADALALTIGDLMTSPVLTCHPRDSLETLMATMTANRVRHLPVEDEHHLAGIITIGDVVKARLRRPPGRWTNCGNTWRPRAKAARRRLVTKPRKALADECDARYAGRNAFRVPRLGFTPRHGDSGAAVAVMVCSPFSPRGRKRRTVRSPRRRESTGNAAFSMTAISPVRI